MTDQRRQNTFTGGELVVDSLIKMGASHAFNISGLGQHDLIGAFYRRREEITYISHLNETCLSLVAQGYARQTRKPAFCIVYHASGTALAMMGLTTAWADNVPLVLVSTTSSRNLGGREQYAGIPRSVIEMGTQFTKWSYEVTVPERIPEVLARAYAIAAEPPMGPVHIAIPMDMYSSVVTDAQTLEGFEQRRHYVEDCADERGLAALAGLLGKAELPVILAGSEVGQLGAVDGLVELAEILGAPVLLEFQPTFLSFPTSHPQYAGFLQNSTSVLEKADMALILGYEFTETGPQIKRSILPKTVATLSVNRFQLTKQVVPDLALGGHPHPSLRRLTELVSNDGVSTKMRDQRLKVSAELRAKRKQEVDAVHALDLNASPVPPTLLLAEVHRKCGPDWIIVQSASTVGFKFDTICEMDNPYDFHSLSGKGSAQGWGAPAAIGVQLAAPNRRVMCLVGDGNLMFSAPSIWAAVKNRQPIIFVVINNNGWAHVPGSMKNLAKTPTEPDQVDRMGWTFGEAPIDYAGFARSMGLRASLAKTGAELGACLDEAMASDKPWLIEVLTGEEQDTAASLTKLPD